MTHSSLQGTVLKTDGKSFVDYKPMEGYPPAIAGALSLYSTSNLPITQPFLQSHIAPVLSYALSKAWHSVHWRQTPFCKYGIYTNASRFAGHRTTFFKPSTGVMIARYQDVVRDVVFLAEDHVRLRFDPEFFQMYGHETAQAVRPGNLIAIEVWQRAGPISCGTIDEQISFYLLLH